MRKKYFTILVAMLMVLCLVLTACGGNNGNGNNESAPSNDATQQADVDENNESTNAPVGDMGGSYTHDLGGGCVIYTKTDLNMFIHDGVFDFYEMMDYFGITGRVDGVDTNMVYMATRKDSDPNYSVQLEGASSSPHCGAIDIDMGGYLVLKTEFFIGDSL